MSEEVIEKFLRENAEAELRLGNYSVWYDDGYWIIADARNRNVRPRKVDEILDVPNVWEDRIIPILYKQER